LRILKNAVAARTEMQVVRRFHAAPQLPPQRRPHMIHKVVKNVLITSFRTLRIVVYTGISEAPANGS